MVSLEEVPFVEFSSSDGFAAARDVFDWSI